MTSSYLSQIAFDVARCAGIAVSALVIGRSLGAKLPRTRWTALLLVAPLLTPALLVSYGYAPFALRMAGKRGLLLLAYSSLLALKLACLAALGRWFFPPRLPLESAFCAKLIERRSLWERFTFSLRTAGGMPWIVLALAFLLAFGDFELASLLSVKSWSVQLFDAHAGGLELISSLERVMVPLAVEAALLGAVLFAVRNTHGQGLSGPAPGRTSPWAFIVAAAIAAVTALIPFALVLVQSARALPLVPYMGMMLQEICTSLSFAIAGAGLAWVLAGFVKWHGIGKFLIVPGLLGALVLSLLVLALFQLSPLSFFYDTPAPLTLALTLLFAPIAFLLRWLIRVQEPSKALHLARMAGVRRLLWDLSLSRRLAAVGLVFLLAYFELTASALLAPVGFTPAFVRLHNLSHYGQTPILSLMLLAATIAPAALLALTLWLGRLYARRDAR